MLCAALAALPLLWRLVHGHAERPNDDTWAYERILRHFIDTGRLRLIDWNDITLVGVMPIARAWSALVGFGTEQLRVLGCLVAFAGLLAVRSSLRRVGAPIVVPALLVVGLFQGFVMTSATFMADQFSASSALWAFALVLGVIDRGARASEAPRPGGRLPSVLGRLQRRDVLALGGAVVLQFAAFTVRQQTATLLPGLLLLLWWHRRRAGLAWLAVGAGFAVPAGVFYLWRNGLDHAGSVLVAVNTTLIIESVMTAVCTIGVGLVPLAILADRTALWRLPWVRLGASTVAAAIAHVRELHHWGSILTRFAQHDAVSRALVAIVVVNVMITVIVALWPSARSAVRRRPELAILLAVLVGGELVTIALSSTYYPRYSLVSLPILLTLLGGSWRSGPVVALPSPGGPLSPARFAVPGLFVVAFLFSFAWLDDTIAPLGAVEDAANVAQCAGIPAERVDGGIVWMGEYAQGVAVSRYLETPIVADGLPETQHRRIFPTSVRDAVVLELPLPDDIAGLVLVGPFRSSGLLPGVDAERWMVVRPEYAPAIERCAEAR